MWEGGGSANGRLALGEEEDEEEETAVDGQHGTRFGPN
jgi:hypothetical protein